MKRVLDFFNRHRHVLVWTACYVAIMWAILQFLFNFDMFSAENWHRLFHAHLRGFPGFVFGILILAMVPMYIASTVIVCRRSAPLFKISLPKWLQPVPATDTTPQPQKSESAPPEPQISEQPANELPRNLPSELRIPFIQARNNLTRPMTSSLNSSHPQDTQHPQSPTPAPQSANELPLPDDFDIIGSDNTTPTFTPMFQDLDFDPDTINDTITNTPAPSTNTDITEYLDAHNRPYVVENGIIITDTDAIAIHDDTDFWIADDETWFAAGRQKPSPADTVLALAAAHNVRPVLYLAETNILDLDARCAHWRDRGITVITSPSELD